MKKITEIIICVVLSLCVSACSAENDSIQKVNINKEEQKTVTIAISETDVSNINYFYNIIKMYKYVFEKEQNVKVSFDIVASANYDEYIRNLNSKLYVKNGPTLIFIPEYATFTNYIESEAALKIEGKIPNYKKIYDSLKENNGFGYFVPIGVRHYPIALNRRLLDELGIDEPSLDWEIKDYLSLKEKWLENNPKYFTQIDYWELMDLELNELKLIDADCKSINLNNHIIIKCINDIRSEIYSNRYILNKNFTFENYYNMLFEPDSKEYMEIRDIQQNTNNKNMRIFVGADALDSLKINDTLLINDKIILPDILSGNTFTQWGFIVNNNGDNTELGIEFLNGLLSDEIQLEMFKSKVDFYPVNKEIEEDIESIEKEKSINENAVALRKYVLELIKNGTLKPYNNKNIIYSKIKDMIYKDFSMFIFANETYSLEDLKVELQKLENKYNIWLKE